MDGRKLTKFLKPDTFKIMTAAETDSVLFFFFCFRRGGRYVKCRKEHSDWKSAARK